MRTVTVKWYEVSYEPAPVNHVLHEKVEDILVSELSSKQRAYLDDNMETLALNLVEWIGPLVFEFEALNGEPWGDAEYGDMYHSEHLYGSSFDPSAGVILWEDVAPLDEEDPDELMPRPEWADELCDELSGIVSSLMAEKFSDHELAFAMWEDNCLFAIVSEK